MKETIIKLIPEGLSEEIKFGVKSSTTDVVIKNSSFTMLENNLHHRIMVSSNSCLRGLVIFIWEEGDDGVFRWKVDINITDQNEFRIEQKTKEGLSRRVDLKIVP